MRTDQSLEKRSRETSTNSCLIRQAQDGAADALFQRQTTMQRQETTYFLEMTAPGELQPAATPNIACEVRRSGEVCPELNRFFYVSVGKEWFWVDRLTWTRHQWVEYLSRPEHETWLLCVAGTPAGYFELDGFPEVEIAYFGLLPHFVGRGLGGYLLTAAVKRAWDKHAAKVWLHTSSFDHPAALANYQSRGFRLVRKETSLKELPEHRARLWPGGDTPT